jgi:hypothetical protein
VREELRLIQCSCRASGRGGGTAACLQRLHSVGSWGRHKAQSVLIIRNHCVDGKSLGVAAQWRATSHLWWSACVLRPAVLHAAARHCCRCSTWVDLTFSFVTTIRSFQHESAGEKRRRRRLHRCSGGSTGEATCAGVTAAAYTVANTMSGKSGVNLRIPVTASRLDLRRDSRLDIVRHYPQIKADAMLPRTNPPCSSSAIYERVCVYGTALPSVAVLRALLAAVGRCRWSSRARGRAHDGRPPLCACSRRLWWTLCARGRRGATAAAAQVAELSRPDGRWSLSRVSPKTAAAATLRSSRPVMPTRRMRWPHAARRVEAGKQDIPRGERCGLLRWARERQSTALATSGGRKRRRRTSSAVLICEARF